MLLHCKFDYFDYLVPRDNMNCLQSTNFFRFVFDPKTSLMTVSVYDSPYRDWNDKLLSNAFNYSEVQK